MGRWDKSNRKERLPSNWNTLRRKALERDGNQCVFTDRYGRCTAKATDVDHIVAGDDHSLENLQSLCHYHHSVKTAFEGHEAWRLKKKKFRQEPEQHPGYIKSRKG